MSRPSSRIPEHRDQPQHRRARTIPPPHNRVRFWLPITLVLIVLVLIIVTWSSRIQRGSREGVISFPSHTMNQEGKRTFEHTHSAGGRHKTRWQNCGVYLRPITHEHAVHSCEHGAV